MSSFTAARSSAIGMTLVVIAWMTAAKAQATTVAPMDLATIADHSGQVISGRIASVRSFWADDPRRIESEITLDDVAYLKGSPSIPTTTFAFTAPGGTVGRMRMAVAGAPEFRVGQRWLLCLLPSYKTHPIVGIYHGAFQIRTGDDGVARVFTAAAAAVVGIDARGFVRATSVNRPPVPDRLVGAVSARVINERGVSTTPEVMTYDRFVERFRPVLEASRDHALTKPAGRRVGVRYTPVPLAGQRNLSRISFPRDLGDSRPRRSAARRRIDRESHGVRRGGKP